MLSTCGNYDHWKIEIMDDRRTLLWTFDIVCYTAEEAGKIAITIARSKFSRSKRIFIKSIIHNSNMIFTQLASGSKANAYLLTANNGKNLLIECGLPWGKLKKKLRYDLSGIVGCLISHEHQDHAKCAKEALQAGIPVFASEGTLKAIGLKGKRNAHLFVRIPSIYSPFILIENTFDVCAFPIQHDAAEPLGFIVRENETEEYLLFATDTAYLEQRFNYQFSIVALECSYQKEILEDRLSKGLVVESLANRLLFTHMELQTTRDYLRKFCDLEKCRQIHLLHCSGDNLDIRAAADLIGKETFCDVITRLNK